MADASFWRHNKSAITAHAVSVFAYLDGVPIGVAAFRTYENGALWRLSDKDIPADFNDAKPHIFRRDLDNAHFVIPFHFPSNSFSHQDGLQ